jgi:type I restriction-modification system DNA methylase subunit
LLLLDPAGRDADNIALGSTLSLDAHPTRRFDYQFANPPYGTEWKIDRDAVMKEAEPGFYGRFGTGLPRISDGQLLFLQHMLAHMNTDTPSFIGIVLNGSPQTRRSGKRPLRAYGSPRSSFAPFFSRSSRTGSVTAMPAFFTWPKVFFQIVSFRAASKNS